MTLGWQWRTGDSVRQSGPGRGTTIQLGPRIGEPNEGIVFEVANDDRYVVKIFPNERPDLDVVVAECVARGLTSTSAPRGLIVAAPRWTVSEPESGSAPIGCTSPKLDPDSFDPFSSYLLVLAREAPLGERIDLALEIADGVDWLHTNRVVIGDLKPDNILRHDDGALGLIDVDSFSFFDERGGRVVGSRVMTDNYRAPEVRSTDYPTYQTDRFALGVIVLELLFGNVHPFAWAHRDHRDDVVQSRIVKGSSWLLDPGNYHAEHGHPGVDVLPEWFRPVVVNCLLERDRPSAASWVERLEMLDVATCSCGAEVFAGGRCAVCAQASATSAAAVSAVPVGDQQPHPAASASGATQRAIAAVVVAALILVAVIALDAYGSSGYFVTERGEEVVIMQGRPDGFLWVDPAFVEGTGVAPESLSAEAQAQLASEPSWSSLEDAQAFVEQLVANN